MIGVKNITTRKKDKKRLVAVFLLSIFICTGVFLKFFTETTEAAWFDENFAYRVPISFTNSGSEVVDQKVKFDIDTSALISAGKMQSDCGDSRFTDANGKLLKYYIDTTGGACNTNSTDYYVLMPKILSGENIVYHYYANPSIVNGTELAQFTQTTFSQTPSMGSEAKAPQPVAYWKFDEGSGTTTQDSTANKNTGTLTNGPIWQGGDMCVSGKCLKFDGSNDYVQTTPINTLTTNFTFSAWVKSTVTGTWQTIYQSGTATNYWRVNIDANNKLDFTKNAVADYASTTALAPNQWNFIEIVKSGDSGSNLTFYINGQVAGTASVGSVVTPSGTAYIGATGAPVNGFIDEVKIYPYARSAAQVLSDFTSRSTAVGGNVLGAQSGALSNKLVGYWKMDESSWNGTAGEVVDSSGTANNGVAQNGQSTSTGRFGNGGSFDGSNDYVQVANSSSLALSGGVTLAAWVKTSGTNDYSGIIQKFNTSNSGWQMTFDVSGGVRADFGNGSGYLTAKNTTNVEDGNWHLVVATYDGTTASIYVDGSKGGTNPTGSGYLTNSSTALLIGTDDCCGTGRNFSGSMDEVRVYSRAFSPQEVVNLYNYAADPIGYWDFEEGKSNTITNKGYYADSATFNNTPKWISGKVGKGINVPLNSLGYVAAVSSGSNYINSTSSSFTFETYVYLTDGRISGGYWYDTNFLTRLGSTNNGSCSTPAGLAVQYRSLSDARIYFTLPYQRSGSSCNQATQLGKSNTVQFRRWYHVAGTFDGSTKQMNFYLDGVLIESGTWGGSGDWTWNGSNLNIGNSGAASDYSLDEVKVYNYVRSKKQITEDMMGGHPSVSGSRTGSMVGYWKMDEGNGTSAKDSSGNGNIGTLTNMATAPSTSTSGWTNSGKFNKALVFDGTNDYVTLANSATLSPGSGDFSISAWVNTTTLNSATHDIYRDYGTGGNHLVALSIDTSNHFTGGFRDGEGDIISPTSTRSLSTNTWYHVVAVRKGTSGYIYVNGVLDGTSTNASTGTIDVSTGDVPTIGSYNSGGNHDLFWNGKIDEVKVYSYALTSDEVKRDYNRGTSQQFGSTGTSASGVSDTSSDRSYCPPGDSTATCAPIGEWLMESKTGTSANDTSGNGFTGTLTNGPIWTSGKVGSGIKFDGTDDYIDVGTSSSLALNTFTVSAWIKTTSTAAQDIFAKKSRSYGGWNAYSLIVGPYVAGSTAGQVSARIQQSSTPTFIDFKTTQTVNDGLWHYITLTYGTDFIGRIYIDGKLAATSSSGTNIYYANQTQHAFIGAGRYCSTPATDCADDTTENPFNGTLDQVRLYNYARSAAQIAWDYNRGGPVAHWKMDECQGNTIHDSSPNRLDGVLTVGASGTQTAIGTCQTSGTAWGNGAVGKINNSLNFDGSNDYIDLSNSTLLTPGTGDFTMEAWVNPSSIGSTRYIYSDIGNSSAVIMYLQMTSAGNLRALYKDTGNNFAAVSSTTVAAVGQWYHVVGIRSGTTVSLYVNGIREGTDTNASLGDVDVLPGAVPNIGKLSGSSASYWSGKIDSVRMYNYALTPQQVKDVYNGGAVRFGPLTGTP